MQKLNRETKKPRFEKVALRNWTKANLVKLTSSSSFANVAEPVTGFRLAHGIDIRTSEFLYSSEKALIAQAISELATATLASVQDVHGHMLNEGPCYHSPQGLISAVKKELIAEGPWMVPDDLRGTTPCVQMVMGMAIAATQIVNEPAGIKAREDLTTLLPMGFSHVDVAGLVAVAAPMASFLEPMIQPALKINGGRDAVDKIYFGLTQMAKEDYTMMHYLVCCGPFVNHFDWGRLESSVEIRDQKKVKITKIKPLKKKLPGYMEGEVIIKVKEQFAGLYVDVSQTETVRKMKARGEKVEKVFFWAKCIDPSFEVPKYGPTAMADAYAYMSQCRNFRGKDDKGLSGWSCGFGACGNPTKLQARLQRKLSLILGALQDEHRKGPVVIEDHLENEMPLLSAQVLAWTRNGAKIKRRLYFSCPNTSVQIVEKLGVHHYQGEDVKDGTWIVFPEIDATTGKKSEWEKTDARSMTLLEREFRNFPKGKGKTQKIVETLLYSKAFFHSDLAVPYTFGSVHNMRGYLSNAEVTVAISDGSSEWHLGWSRLVPVKEEEFYRAVVSHNGHRTGYFLCPKYYFNPKMNFLRHIKGKTVDFEKLEVRDIVGHEYDEIANFQEGFDLEEEVREELDIIREEDLSLTEESEEGEEYEENLPDSEGESVEDPVKDEPKKILGREGRKIKIIPVSTPPEEEKKEKEVVLTKKKIRRSQNDNSSNSEGPPVIENTERLTGGINITNW
jgi:hypothetical protein